MLLLKTTCLKDFVEALNGCTPKQDRHFTDYVCTEMMSIKISTVVM